MISEEEQQNEEDRTYAQAPYLVGAHSCAPLQMLFQGWICISPRNIREAVEPVIKQLEQGELPGS